MTSRRMSFAAGLVGAGMAAAVAVAQTPRLDSPFATAPTCEDRADPASAAHLAMGSCIPTVPDPKLTPGAITTRDKTEICGRDAQGRTYSEAHRVWHDKRGTLAKYGMPWSVHDQVEDDDRVPVGLGGDNASPLNHWPEPWQGAVRKDRIERDMIRDVCDGRISLDAAQRYFLGDKWKAK